MFLGGFWGDFRDIVGGFWGAVGEELRWSLGGFGRIVELVKGSGINWRF